MIHDLSVAILGTLPDSALWVYSALDLILAVVLIIICISPFILVIKLLGGR